MRVQCITEQGELYGKPSVSREVEQFHYIAELLEGKKVSYLQSNSTMDFKSLAFNNQESYELDKHQEYEIFSRRYTLPRGFKYIARKITSKPKQTEEPKEVMKGATDSIMSGENTTNLVRCNTASDLFLNALFSEEHSTTEKSNESFQSLRDLGLRQLFRGKLKPSLSFENLGLKQLFKEPVAPGYIVGDMYIKMLFKENRSEEAESLEEYNLDTLFKEKRKRSKGKAVKAVAKAIKRPFKALGQSCRKFHMFALIHFY